MRFHPRDDVMLTQAHAAAFNRIVQNSAVSVKALPTHKFQSGETYFLKKKEQESALVVHNNFIIGADKKRKRFKEYGMWDYTVEM